MSNYELEPNLPRGAHPFFPAKHLGGSGFALDSNEIFIAKKNGSRAPGTYIHTPERVEGMYFVPQTAITESELVAMGLEKESEESIDVT